MFDVKWISCTW